MDIRWPWPEIRFPEVPRRDKVSNSAQSREDTMFSSKVIEICGTLFIGHRTPKVYSRYLSFMDRFKLIKESDTRSHGSMRFCHLL